MRLYEIAKKLGLSNKEAVEALKEKKLGDFGHMATIPDEAIEYLQLWSAEKNKIFIELKPMTLGDFSQKIRRPASEIILNLLKTGILSNKHYILQPELMLKIIALYPDVSVIESNVSEQKEEGQDFSVIDGKSRIPVVVIVGHVDHGKTSLLDYIRNSRVAHKEKGGITQHLGAYQVKTKFGEIVFLDTPGHEAFSQIRVRGAKVADIAILLVACDDGVMPQTIEAINAIKASGVQAIVAINKMDKCSDVQFEKVKTQLSQHGLISEDWGGDTIFVPVSAKTGAGVDSLLESIEVQSQMMELVANYDQPGIGYVLESKLEKGRGPVATILLRNGVLKVGDYVIVGETAGKISSLIDSQGKRISQATPSTPVSVSGLESVAKAGSFVRVVGAVDYKKFIESSVYERRSAAIESLEGAHVRVILKADNFSSLEALNQVVSKISSKYKKNIAIVKSSIGEVLESDVDLASETDSLIFALHTKISTDAQSQASKLSVAVRSFDIIYKLSESLEAILEKDKPVKKVQKKVAEASVIKIFDIKSLGVIAGAIVKSGKINKDCKAVVWRGKYKVGEGFIKSLQREKKSVKEVNAGFDCGFLLEGFNDWLIDDRVEFFQEVVVEK